MAISGHKSRNVFDRYNIVGEAGIMEAARQIEQRSVIHSSFRAVLWIGQSCRMSELSPMRKWRNWQTRRT